MLTVRLVLAMLGGMEKLYCYVDESGQHTGGAVFVVSVIVAKAERDLMVLRLDELEHQTGKGLSKWMKTRQEIGEAYLRAVFSEPLFAKSLYYSTSSYSTDFKPLTIIAIAGAVTAARSSDEYKVSAFIDGLKRSEERTLGSRLRRIGIRTEKVRGVADESNALIRLADAIAGCAREASEGNVTSQSILKHGLDSGVFQEV
jgi:hypothetical protein